LLLDQQRHLQLVEKLGLQLRLLLGRQHHQQLAVLLGQQRQLVPQKS
jgi:hypothetical protein